MTAMRSGSKGDDMGTRQLRTRRRFALFAATLSVVAASLLVEGLHELEPPYRLGVVAVLAIGVIASSYHPLKIVGRSGEMTSDMDHAALVATAFVLPLHHALVAFALGEALLHVARRKPARTFAFNVAQQVISAWACLHVMYAIAPITTFGWREVLAVGAGVTVYELCSFLLVAGAVSTDRGVSYWGFVRSAYSVDDNIAYVGAAALGYLTGVAARSSLGAGLLVAGPILLVHNITRGFEAAFYDRIRARALADAASVMHQATSRDVVVGVLIEQAGVMLRTETPVLRSQPPGRRELGVQLHRATDEPCWLVAAPGPNAGPFSTDDEHGLRALADITETTLARLVAVTELEFRATHDSLTGVANRASFLETVDQAIRRRQRYGGSDALLFIDLDAFKGVNDGLGHGAGDELLIAVADRLRNSVRPSDVVARLGGDEFCVLALEITDEAAAATVADAALAAIRRAFELSSATVTISASVGVALLPAAGASADKLIKAADEAMYTVKSAAKDGVAFASPDGGRSGRSSGRSAHVRLVRNTESTAGP